MLMKFEEELYGIAPGVKHTKPSTLCYIRVQMTIQIDVIVFFFLVLHSFFEDNKIRKKFDWEKDLEMMSKFQYLKVTKFPLVCDMGYGYPKNSSPEHSSRKINSGKIHRGKILCLIYS